MLTVLQRWAKHPQDFRAQLWQSQDRLKLLGLVEETLETMISRQDLTVCGVKEKGIMIRQQAFGVILKFK